MEKVSDKPRTTALSLPSEGPAFLLRRGEIVPAAPPVVSAERFAPVEVEVPQAQARSMQTFE